jgi:hypothetical protein
MYIVTTMLIGDAKAGYITNWWASVGVWKHFHMSWVSSHINIRGGCLETLGHDMGIWKH